MVKYFENQSLFPFKWEQVVHGFWQRYPNPESKHVLSEDVLHREVKDKKLHSIRMFTKTNKLPKWGERFIHSNVVRIVEESIVDPAKKTLVTYTRNIGYTSVMGVTEKVIYKVNEENPSTTVAERSVWIESNVFGMSKAIKAFGLQRFKVNSAKAVKGFNYVLNSMYGTNVANPTAGGLMHQKEKFKDALKQTNYKPGSYYVH
ncbi:PRELI domain-containing protein 1, mitochondrial [Adelges cooleyi]|uniref:PRELI domain-containing protein 1, mitochondrial n=1 Tax=Adelges cooleyi TaxID=133065 RepID=UPI0021807894|nr:PRELI domain-containing protein 1, mitochondrial [Adelges cooleyi]XP_050420563.1 PRELI domain-containing protein 1, mitochondrial [Adelges cooleyi]